MNITVYDTLPGMRAVLKAPVEQRKAVYREQLIEPLRGYWQPLLDRYAPGQPENEETLRTMIWDFDFQADASRHLAALERLEAAKAWSCAEDAIRQSIQAIENEGQSCLIPHISCVLTPGNPDDKYMMHWLKGSVGVGGINSFIIFIWPTEENLPRLSAVIAHEFHHKVRLEYEPWSSQMTLGRYLVLEGQAESFAQALYGPERIGPWVTSLNDEELEYSRKVIADALKIEGLKDISGYIFGDQMAERMHYTPRGLPFCAGYAVGYQMVQAYLHKTGRSIVEATFTPSEEIIEQSGYFE